MGFKGEVACIEKLHRCIRVVAPKGFCAGRKKKNGGVPQIANKGASIF